MKILDIVKENVCTRGYIHNNNGQIYSLSRKEKRDESYFTKKIRKNLKPTKANIGLVAVKSDIVIFQKKCVSFEWSNSEYRFVKGGTDMVGFLQGKKEETSSHWGKCNVLLRGKKINDWVFLVHRYYDCETLSNCAVTFHSLFK